MSKTGQIVLWIVVAVIVIGGIWWWVASRNHASTVAPAMNSVPTASTTSMAGASTTASTSYPQGDSDQSINEDMTNLNTQLNGLNSDNASITQSMNDQPVQQAE